MGILNNKGKPKHKRLRRHIGKPLTALAAVLCVAVAPVASANMNVIDVSGWQSADVTRVVDADAAIVKITEGGGYVNPSWRSQTDWARQTGKACGGYHYADGGNLIGIDSNDTVAIHPGVTVLVRLCGYEDASLVTMLKNLGLPLTFAASDHPY